MGDKVITGIVAIVTAIIGVAIIAVLVANKSNTPGVLSAAGSAFSSILSAAVSPLTGGGIGSSVSGGLLGQPI
jgi:hypothetical protein